jgi:propanol-preferring alcohol dehydrogenase
LEGEETLCANQRATGVNVDGGHAEYVLARADYLHRLPAGLPFEEAAALTCPGMTAYTALKLGGLRPGGRVAVLGLGGVGHLAVQYAKAMGAEVVLLTRGGQEKLSLAKELGADQALDLRENGAGRALQEIGGVVKQSWVSSLKAR